MVVALFVSLFSVFGGYLAQFRRYRFCFYFAFAGIVLFLGLRYMWGNDMPEYLNLFHTASLYTGNFWDFEQINNFYGKEYGWFLLNYLFQPLGFWGLQFFLAIVQNIIIFYFIKKYVAPRWYWLAIFIYCFNVSYMVMSASLMRQFLAQCIIILASQYIIKRKIVHFISYVFLAYLIHKSAIFFLPFYFISYLNFKLSNKRLIVFLVIIILWMSFAAQYVGDFLETIVVEFIGLGEYQAYFGKEYVEESFTSIITKLFFTICLLSQMKKLSREMQILTALTIVYVLISPLKSLAPMLGRVEWYFSIFSIYTYPKLVEVLDDKPILRCTVLLCILVLNVNLFVTFFDLPNWHQAFYEYRSVLSNSY